MGVVNKIVFCVLLSVLQLAEFIREVHGQFCPQQDYVLFAEGRVINITSPNYPNAYTRGSSCRYRITAPLDYIVAINCQFDVYPNTCGSELFYVSPDGDMNFRYPNTYCVTTNIRINSNFRTIAFAFSSRNRLTTQQGRFICQAQARRQVCQCGRNYRTRITNGQEATRHEYPYMVALRYENSPQNIFCGGTILSHRHILTAAHCMIQHSEARRVIANVGDHDLSSSTDSPYSVKHRIQQIIIHPGYQSTATSELNDIALLVTQQPIEWSRGVGPICLPIRQRNDMFAYQMVDVIGWGTLSFAGSKSNTLQKVQLMAMRNDVCQQQYNASISPQHLCTYDFRGLGQDSCQYDSGGPVILKQQERSFLIGAISSGRACGIPRHSISLNSRITSHIDWLFRYVGGMVCAA